MRKPSNNREDIYNKYLPVVRAAVRSVLSGRWRYYSQIDVEDLEQIGWVTLIECIPHYDPSKSKFETYVSVCIARKIRKELIKQLANNIYVGRTLEVADKEYSDMPELMKELVDIIEERNILTNIERKIFWVRFLENTSFEKIGERFHISRETARKHFYSAVDKLTEAERNGFQSQIERPE